MSRIPDVGNPWLDAGIVRYSTLSYRADPDFWRKWFPANWISESFPGQFRNWFYSLLAMSTVLENAPPFLQNFGYASLYAEDGREMHKSWGNSIEFNEAADKMGVDVMRWLYCAHKPENNLLFGYNRAEETRRQFLIPLWNVYSFFSTYASLDGWTPIIGAVSILEPQRAPHQRVIIPSISGSWPVSTRSWPASLKISTNSDAYTATLAFESLMDDSEQLVCAPFPPPLLEIRAGQRQRTPPTPPCGTCWSRMSRALAPGDPFHHRSHVSKFGAQCV